MQCEKISIEIRQKQGRNSIKTVSALLLYSDDIMFYHFTVTSKKENLFLCLEFLHCGIWTVNSGLVL